MTRSRFAGSTAVCVALIFGAFLLLGLPRTAAAQDGIEIKPTGTTDEAEFLLYNYRKMRGQIPATIYHRGQIQKSLTDLRDRVNRYHEFAKERKVDPKIQALYADLLSAIDITSDYLTDLDRIDRGILARADRDSAQAGYKAGFAGGYVASAARQDGASGGDAALAGIATAAITYFFEDMKNRQALDESKRQALETASEGFKRKMSVVQARETNRLSDFADKYRWKKDASGYRVDSFTQLENDLTTQYTKASTAEEAMKASKALLDAARVVPPGAVYDEHRGYALYWAARAATWAGEQEMKGKKWGSVASPSASEAIKLWEAALRYSPADPDGFKRSQKAWALAIAGRLNDGIDEANKVFKVRQGEPAFMYNYVCLWSLAGKQQDTTIANLRSVLSQGAFYSELDAFRRIEVQQIRTDPNLADLRSAKGEQFTELVQVKWAWNVSWGVFNDDIVLTNKSAFPISNIVLTARIESGGRVWTPTLKGQNVGPGQNLTWSNVMSIPGSRFDKATATLTCDQAK